MQPNINNATTVPGEVKPTEKMPGDHWQNPADPTRKEGDITPIYAEDHRLDAGEDLQEPQLDAHPSNHSATHAPSKSEAAVSPRNSGEISKVF